MAVSIKHELRKIRTCSWDVANKIDYISMSLEGVLPYVKDAAESVPGNDDLAETYAKLRDHIHFAQNLSRELSDMVEKKLEAEDEKSDEL